MSFAIMRCVKLKNLGAVGASLQHCFRERDTLNADKNLTPQNEHFYAHSENAALGKLRELLPEKIRKNGVIAIEYVMTASPEWFEQADKTQRHEFFQSSLQWLKDKYGEQNIFTATIHNDEKTPHLSAFVCPKTADGRLCAREFIGGRDKLQQDQDTFAEAVKDLGLERGLKGSKAKHMTIQQYYSSLTQTAEVQKITAEELAPQGGFFHKEKPEEVAERLNRRLEQSTLPIRNKATEYEREKQRRQTAEKIAEQKKQEIQVLKERGFKNAKTLDNFKKVFTDGLTKEQTQELIKNALRMKIENQRKQQARGAVKPKYTQPEFDR